MEQLPAGLVKPEPYQASCPIITKTPSVFGKLITMLCYVLPFGLGSCSEGGRQGWGWGGFHITHGPCHTSIWVNSFSFFVFVHILVRGLRFWFGGGNRVITMVEMLTIQAMICRASLSPSFPGCLIYS